MKILKQIWTDLKAGLACVFLSRKQLVLSEDKPSAIFSSIILIHKSNYAVFIVKGAKCPMLTSACDPFCSPGSLSSPSPHAAPTRAKRQLDVG